MAAHSSILAWEIPWTEEPGRLQTMRSQRVGRDLVIMPPQESFNDDSQDLLLFQENFVPGTQGLCQARCHPSTQGHLVVTNIGGLPTSTSRL